MLGKEREKELNKVITRNYFELVLKMLIQSNENEKTQREADALLQKLDQVWTQDDVIVLLTDDIEKHKGTIFTKNDVKLVLGKLKDKKANASKLAEVLFNDLDDIWKDGSEILILSRNVSDEMKWAAQDNINE